MKKIISVCVSLLLGTIFALGLAELVLHFYHPFEMSLQGEHIVLKTKTEKVLKTSNPKLSPEIEVRTNNLGFRGKDYPENPKDFFKIFTVGGSTTQSLYNPEGKTWADLLSSGLTAQGEKIWLNNAGLSGHSTKGHQVLLQEHLLRLKPDMILFLVGINDVGRKIESAPVLPLPEVFFKSELLTLGLNIYRAQQSKKLNLTYDLEWDPTKLEKLEINGIDLSRNLMFHSKTFLPFYRRRLETLVRTCLENKIQAVLITQPLVYGQGFDPMTGVDLGKLKIGNENSFSVWKTLELYNDVTRIVARKEGIPLIDLAKMMPKDSRLYFDYMHFSDKGAEKVAELILPELKRILKEKKPN